MIGRLLTLAMLPAAIVGVMIYLPLVVAQPQAAPPPETIVCTPPAGITLHLTNPQLQLDATGRVFCATRASSSIGGVVWTMDGDHARILIPTDTTRFYANGEFSLIAGVLYYVSVDQSARRIEAIKVPEWTP